MPAGLVQAPALTLSVRDEETIRRALHGMTADERFELYQRITQLDAAGASIPALRNVVLDSPGGTIMRECIAELAFRRIDAIAARQDDADTQSGNAKGQSALPWRRHLTARIGSAGQWADRRTHWLSLHDFDLDRASQIRHYPVELRWCHRPQAPLGLSRAIWAASDGSLKAVFELAATPVARAAADLMAGRAVGFSVGTEGGYHEWAGILDPDEWAPSEGRSDLLIQRYPTIREVSVTPFPLFDDTAVEACY